MPLAYSRQDPVTVCPHCQDTSLNVRVESKQRREVLGVSSSAIIRFLNSVSLPSLPAEPGECAPDDKVDNSLLSRLSVQVEGGTQKLKGASLQHIIMLMVLQEIPFTMPPFGSYIGQDCKIVDDTLSKIERLSMIH